MAVYPVHKNVFTVGTLGVTSTPTDMKPIADMETFEVSVDGTVIEWTPMDQEGWMRRLMTGKSISITLTGKRNYGDDGNDYAAGLALVADETATTLFEWTLPDATVLSMNAVLDVTSFGGGGSTDVGALEIIVKSDGKPVLT